MPKGLISQTMVILLDQPIKISDLRGHLAEDMVIQETPAADSVEISGPALILKFLPEVKGVISLDVVNQPWPDDMGKQDERVFVAWSMGFFGPFAYPGNLARAVMQSGWRWNGAAEVVEKHRAYLRMRCSYSMFNGEPSNKDDVCLPENYNPLMELNFMTDLARLFLNYHSNALCYFNPNGEAVISKELFEETYLFHQNQSQIALDLWTNIRIFDINPEWCLMDIVGNGQLDEPDHEVVFPKGQFNPNDFSAFLRDLSMYVLSKAKELRDGDTIGGPGKIRWKAMKCVDSVCVPPRETWRWFPVGVENFPEITLVRERPKPQEEPHPPQLAKKQSTSDPTPAELGHFDRFDSATKDFILEARKLWKDPDSGSVWGRFFGAQPAAAKLPGELVWGVFVRCFWPAYTPGKNQHFGSIVFSFDPHFDDMQNLIPVANAVWRIRSSSAAPPPGAEKFASIIRNDRLQAERISVPTILFEGKQAYLNDIAAERNCFPTGYLHCRLVPVLAEKNTTKVRLLPLKYWPEKFQTLWRSEAPALSKENVDAYREGSPKIVP